MPNKIKGSCGEYNKEAGPAWRNELGINGQLLSSHKPWCNARLGGLHSAPLVISSVDFAHTEQLQHKGEWDKTADILIREAKHLETAGAKAI